MTHGDRIRNMTDEEIFHNYYRLIPCKECGFRNKCNASRNLKIAGDIENYKKCREIWLKWLGEEDGKSEW